MNYKKYLHKTLWPAALVVVAAALLLFERDLLWKVQELNLFLYTPLFFKQMMAVPAGLLTWLGSYFTQFFFYPWLGVLLMCAWWWLLMWLTKRTFRLTEAWNVVALVPVALLLVANMDMGYWVYVLKLHGWFFDATIGTAAAVALLWAFRSVPARTLPRCLTAVVACVAGYPLIGVYALGAVVLMGLWALRHRGTENGNGSALLQAAVAWLSVVAVPLVYYRYVYEQTSMANIYWAGLPIYIFREEYHQYYTPFYLLALFFVVLTLVVQRREERGERREKKGVKEYWNKLQPVLRGVLLVALVVGVAVFWFKDDNFHRELRMQHSIERLDWQGVLNVARKQKEEPTRAVVMMRNLALSRLWRQGDEMYNYPGGSMKSNAPFLVLMSQVAGHLIYYHYGLLNDCHRTCMEEGVEMGFRVEHLQYMARCAMLCQEPQTARKYLDILSKTRFYNKWTRWLEPMVGDTSLMAKTPEMGPIVHMMHYKNKLGSDNGLTEKYLMSLLASQDADDPWFQEQALLATLWSRNKYQFWRRYKHYAQMHLTDRLPRHYQEAAYLHSRLSKRRDLSSLPFDEDVKRSYEAFMTAWEKCRHLPIEQVRVRLAPDFGNTYYFDYFFMKDLTLM